MFSSISEVPQYQRFYKKVEKAFALNEMFHDVQEPMTQLAEIQQQEAEAKQQQDDKELNRTVIALSLLTIVSALTDAADIPTNLTWLIPWPWLQRTVQGIALGFVVFVVGRLIYRLISLRKK